MSTALPSLTGPRVLLGIRDLQHDVPLYYSFALQMGSFYVSFIHDQGGGGGVGGRVRIELPDQHYDPTPALRLLRLLHLRL